MWIINHRKFFYILSGLFMGAGLVSMLAFLPWNFGIEFTGGSILEVEYANGRPAIEEMRQELEKLEWSGTAIQETGESGYIIRTKSLTEEERLALVSLISGNGKWQIDVKRFDSIGPTIGKELRTKAGWAIGLVILAIILYIAFAFRGVSHPVSSWVYGFVAIVALVHDVIIPTGLYVAFGHFFIDVQVDVLFVVAILTVLGFSVHDTIVVFDRTRENLKLRTWKEFDTTVGHSVTQTITRSINTSLTVLLVVLALYFVGSETTKNFAMILGVGIIAGTYSSIFLASPLLVSIEEWQRRKGEKKR